jgi:thiamine biosynthesis lipoprotein
VTSEKRKLVRHDSYFAFSFFAMASPCEILIESHEEKLAQALASCCEQEVRRIEEKFSRYAKNNLCYQINNAKGKSVAIDEECFNLLQFADTCYSLSDGLFDLTSGVLRRAWTFDGSDNIPLQSDIDRILPLVGWEKLNFDEKTIQMPSGMEIDFGGIGKEYAVSRAADNCRQLASDVSMLVNLGGDIQITKPRKDQQPWVVGIDNDNKVLPIQAGAIATSGDANRYLLKDGVRYSHILNPKTGWPVEGAPASVTIAAALCVQAGCLATLALLNGKDAEKFLDEQGVQYWLTR